MKIIKIKATQDLYSLKGLKLASVGQILEVQEDVGRRFIDAQKAVEYKPDRIPVDLKKMMAKAAEPAEGEKKKRRNS